MLKKERWNGPVPTKEFHRQFEETLTLLEEKEEVRESRKKHGTWKKAAAFFGTMAASAAAFTGVCLANPVWASGLPLIGQIFHLTAEQQSFQGDYEKYAEPVEQNESAVQKDNGISMSISETYCSKNALYVSFLLESAEAFPDTYETENGPIFALKGSGKFSYNQQEQPLHVYPEGKFTDENTYAGVLRIDLLSTLLDTSKLEQMEAKGEVLYDAEVLAEYGEELELPEQFQVDLDFNQMIGDLKDPEVLDTGYTAEELEAMSEEEWQQVMETALNGGDWNQYPNKHENWWRDGTWRFHLEVKADQEEIQTIEVNEQNEQGIGVSSISLTPFEITLEEKYENPLDAENYFAVMLDKNGAIFDEAGPNGSADVRAVSGHDTSTVFVYICDYTEYMDELKGYYYKEGADKKQFQQMLEERAVYKTKVHFESMQ